MLGATQEHRRLLLRHADAVRIDKLRNLRLKRIAGARRHPDGGLSGEIGQRNIVWQWHDGHSVRHERARGDAKQKRSGHHSGYDTIVEMVRGTSTESGHAKQSRSLWILLQKKKKKIL